MPEVIGSKAIGMYDYDMDKCPVNDDYPITEEWCSRRSAVAGNNSQFCVNCQSAGRICSHCIQQGAIKEGNFCRVTNLAKGCCQFHDLNGFTDKRDKLDIDVPLLMALIKSGKGAEMIAVARKGMRKDLIAKKVKKKKEVAMKKKKISLGELTKEEQDFIKDYDAENVGALEFARFVKGLKEKYGIKNKNIADFFGKPWYFIGRHVAILKLPQGVLAMMESSVPVAERLKLYDVFKLLSLNNSFKQIEEAKKIVAKKEAKKEKNEGRGGKRTEKKTGKKGSAEKGPKREKPVAAEEVEWAVDTERFVADCEALVKAAKDMAMEVNLLNSLPDETARMILSSLFEKERSELKEAFIKMIRII